MSPKAVPPKVAMTARPVEPRALDAARQMIEVGVGDGAELLEVVGGIEAGLVDRRLAHDGVEEGAAHRHAPARRGGNVALGKDQDIARRLLHDPKVFADHYVEAAEIPWFPVLIGEAEHVVAREDANSIDAERGSQIVIHQAQHLVGLVHLHGDLLQAEVLAQGGDATHMDAGDGGAAEIDRDAVGALVTESGGNTGGGSDGYFFHCFSISSRLLPLVSGVNFQTNRTVMAQRTA